MLSPIQLNTSAHRPIRSARGPVPIRFGNQSDKTSVPISIDTYESSVGGLFAKYADRYSAAIKGLPDFGQKETDSYKGYSFAKSYQALTPRAQRQVEELAKHIRPEDVEKMKRENVLGVIEESSDMLFEAYTLKALHQGLLTNQKVDELKRKYLPASTDQARQEKPFDTFLKEVDKDLAPEKVNSLKQSLPWTPEKSRKMLDLIAAKFILMRSRDNNFDIQKKTQPLLMDESKEFRDVFPRLSPRRAQIWLLGFIYTHFPQLPLSFLASQLKNIASSRVQTQIHTEDLLENVETKQNRRQRQDYATQDRVKGLNNEQRRKALKSVLKGVEVLNEAAHLKNARLWHPTQEIAVF